MVSRTSSYRTPFPLHYCGGLATLFFMCFVKPLRVKSIKGKEVTLENGTRAFYEKKVGILKPNDRVLVYGNLILEKISKKQDEQTK